MASLGGPGLRDVPGPLVDAADMRNATVVGAGYRLQATAFARRWPSGTTRRAGAANGGEILVQG